MKVPTKSELRNRLAETQRENFKLVEKLNADKIKRWNDLLPAAYAEARKTLLKVFGTTLTLLHFEHVDEGGYWFTFELINDSRRQTYCVHHDEI